MSRRQPPRFIQASHSDHQAREMTQRAQHERLIAETAEQARQEAAATRPALAERPASLPRSPATVTTPPASAPKLAPKAAKKAVSAPVRQVRRGKLPSGVDPLTVPLHVALAMIQSTSTTDPRSST